MSTKPFGLLRKRLFRVLRVPQSFILSINKRQRFVLAVVFCATLLFVSENLLGRSGFYVTFILSLLSGFLFFLSVYTDVGEKRSLYVFILPIFLYTLSVGLFYFLIPPRFLSRLIITVLYAGGLYSLYLSQNIHIISALRTIPLLSGARIVSFVTTFFSYFFLTAVLYSLTGTLVLPIYVTGLVLLMTSFLAVFQSMVISYEKSIRQSLVWSSVLSLCLLEVGVLLWFWPTTPTVVAIFLTGFFYTIVGISHVWLEKRLFRGVIWEYVWVSVLMFAILIVSTSWQG
ncbi:MAG: hypothetical protein AAB907_00640 [Patescibacteria group bacterium]